MVNCGVVTCQKDDMETKPYEIRLSKEQHRRLRIVALNLGYTYGSEGSISLLMQAIADEKLKTVPKNTWQTTGWFVL